MYVFNSCRKSCNPPQFIWHKICNSLPGIFFKRLLNEAQGSLLDDEQLVNTLQQSKITSQEVTESLVVSEDTEKKIDAAREVSPDDS